MSRITEVLFVKNRWVNELNTKSGNKERVLQTSSRFFTVALFVEVFISREHATKVIQDVVDDRHDRRNMFSGRHILRGEL